MSFLPITPRSGRSCVLALCLFSTAGQAGSAPRVVAWGAGTFVTTNDSDLYNYGQSIVPSGLTNAVLAAGGWRHSLALKSSGTLVGWGDDALGQNVYPALTNYIAVVCGGLHSLGLLSNGTVAAWGDDFYGQAEAPTNLSDVVAIAGGPYHHLAPLAHCPVPALGT